MSSKVQRNHREMYKARTPPWKETYRKRCLERLKGSREKLQARFRQLNKEILGSDGIFVEELMRDELKQLREEQGREDLGMGNIDEVLSLFEDIQEELRREELLMLEEIDRYERSRAQEESVLCSAVEKLCTDEVLCPVCQKSPLLANKSVIFCNCGLRIDTEQDCLTLTNIKHLLEEGLQQHGASCEAPPKFSVISEINTQNLVMICGTCDWMSIVI